MQTMQLNPYKHLALACRLDEIPTAEIVEQALARLTYRTPESVARAQFVMRHRFGFGGVARMTLQEVGEQLGGYSRERIRQIEAQTLRQLRSRILYLQKNP